jgi:hypothetical protein
MLVVTNDKNLVNIGLVELPPLVNALPQAHDEIGEEQVFWRARISARGIGYMTASLPTLRCPPLALCRICPWID